VVGVHIYGGLEFDAIPVGDHRGRIHRPLQKDRAP
jgi:hypothetical protein